MPTYELYFLGQVVLAIILGAVLGIQRERWGKSAGPRTYALVSAGAALFTILSAHAFGADTARVSAGIVTGIGFLGAGTILHKENRVEGLTTAAGLWMVSAIGMAVGLGFYVLSVCSTLVILVVLMLNDDRFIKKTESEKDEGK